MLDVASRRITVSSPSKVFFSERAETKVESSLWGSSGTHVAYSQNKNPQFRGFLERMMGLEPTTFCMASARELRTSSRPFAETSCLQRFGSGERTAANANER
jgi:hypothetical protein